MKVYKGKHASFTVISNEIFKHGLSLKAIGLYSYIINKPDGWEFSVGGTATQLKDGKASVQTAVNQLEEAGFLVRSQNRKSDGGFGENIWWVFASPSEKPSTGKRLTEKHAQVNTNKVNTKRERENSLSLKEKESLTEQYEVTEEALNRVYFKYLGWCDSTGRKYSKEFFINNFLPKEEWRINDYNISKKGQVLLAQAMEQGGWNES